MANQQKTHSCGQECEVYSRVCGYFRPYKNWNKGKKQEFKERVKFNVQKYSNHTNEKVTQ